MHINFSQLLIDGLLQSIQHFWQFYLLIAFVIAIKVLYLIYGRYRLGKAGMFEIDKMSGDDFERYLAMLFEKLGYRVQIVGSHKGDYGTDLILEKQGVRTAVQAKCWHNSVGIKSIQEVYGSLHFYNCTKAIVVTNNYFTQQAKRLAETNNVELWDRYKLTQVIL